MTESNEPINAEYRQLSSSIQFHVLPNRPDLLLIGKLCGGERFELSWKPYEDKPWFIKAKGTRVEYSVALVFPVTAENNPEDADDTTENEMKSHLDKPS